MLTDPEQRSALAAARALAGSGHRVITIGVRRGIAGASRAVAGHEPIGADTARTPDAMIEAVASAVVRHRVDVVIPVTDAASRILLHGRGRIGARVAGPTAEAYDRASDKEGLLALAPTVGLRVPQQTALSSPDALSEILPALRFPLVVKPARSAVTVNGQITRASVSYAATADVLRRIVGTMPAPAFPLLLQERIVGDGIGVFLLRDRGETLLAFAHRRIREKPPSGGVSTLRESIPLDPALARRCAALLDALRYDGAAMIELKVDAASGEPVLMEINARLWGSLQLSIDAGLDFPTALVALTMGRPIPEAAKRAGMTKHVRTYWEMGELDHALALLRRTHEQLHAPPTLKVGARAALRALADRRWSDRAEVFRWSDPLPFLVELASWVRGQ